MSLTSHNEGWSPAKTQQRLVTSENTTKAGHLPMLVNAVFSTGAATQATEHLRYQNSVVVLWPKSSLSILLSAWQSYSTQINANTWYSSYDNNLCFSVEETFSSCCRVSGAAVCSPTGWDHRPLTLPWVWYVPTQTFFIVSGVTTRVQ